MGQIVKRYTIFFIVLFMISMNSTFADTFRSINKLEKGVKKSITTQKKIAKNIANLSNPNYVPRDKDVNGFKIDRKVLLEKEMAKMSKNQIKYNAYLRLMTLKYQNLRKAYTLGK